MIKKAVIFIHGCFWHGHKNCPCSKRPTTNKEFWQKKIDRNIHHDKEIVNNLKESGWEILIVWTCEIKDLNQLKDKHLTFLKKSNKDANMKSEEISKKLLSTVQDRDAATAGIWQIK